MPFLKLFRIQRTRGKLTVEQPKKVEILSKESKPNKLFLCFSPNTILL